MVQILGRTFVVQPLVCIGTHFLSWAAAGNGDSSSQSKSNNETVQLKQSRALG